MEGFVCSRHEWATSLSSTIQVLGDSVDREQNDAWGSTMRALNCLTSKTAVVSSNVSRPSRLLAETARSLTRLIGLVMTLYGRKEAEDAIDGNDPSSQVDIPIEGKVA